jgi:signal transduction histidine kinase
VSHAGAPSGPEIAALGLSGSDREETRLHPISLRFARPDLEREFQHAHFRRFLPQIRVALLLALFLYAIFGALDPFVVPQATRLAWFLRYAIGCPLILLAVALSFTSGFERWAPWAWAGLGLYVGGSLIAMMWRDSSALSHLYYAGLTLTCVYLYTFVRLSFVAASVTCWSLVVVYQATALWSGATPTPVLVSNALFLLSINIIGMSVCYWMERGGRVDFLQQRLIARQAEELRRTLGELEAKNADLDSFVYSVSHDLKSPLVAVQGLAGMIVEDYGGRLDDEGRHLLGRVQANVEHMERLIQDLLELSRVGRESRGPERVPMADVVEELVAEAGAAIRERGIEVTSVDLGALWGVRTRIEQVMRNLLGNAIKYMGDTASPAIEIGMREGGPLVECWVRDNGIGIDPEYQDKVFEIFQRLHDVDVEGTGVGLAITRRIVEAVGGRLWVESSKGRGATFRFTWPSASARATAEP